MSRCFVANPYMYEFIFAYIDKQRFRRNRRQNSAMHTYSIWTKTLN